MSCDKMIAEGDCTRRCADNSCIADIAYIGALCCLREHVDANNADCPQRLVEFDSYSTVVCHV